MNNNYIMVYNNEIYRLVSVEPHLKNINLYKVVFQKYTLYYYNRRTSGNKYSYNYSNHFFLMDLSDVPRQDREDFVMNKWKGFVSQLYELSGYANNTLIPFDNPVHRVHPSQHNGELQINFLYTTQDIEEQMSFPTIQHMYINLLLITNSSPYDLNICVWAGYENRSANDVMYYGANYLSRDYLNLKA